MLDSVDIPSFICKYIESLDLIKGVSSNTLQAYQSDLLQVFQLSETIEICRINTHGLITYEYCLKNKLNSFKPLSSKEWQEVLQAGLRRPDLKQRSRKRKLSSVNQFLLWLKSEHQIDLNFQIQQTLDRSRKLPHFLSVDECLALAQYCDSLCQPTLAEKEQILLFYLLYGTGLRISEACNLKWQAISPTRLEMRIMGKGKKERIVVMPPKTWQALEKYGCRQEEYIWGATPLPRRTGYHRVRKLGEKAQLFKPLHPHALRHSFATQMLTGGSDLRIVQQLLGHKSLAATEVYTHLDINDLARSLESHHPLSKK